MSKNEMIKSAQTLKYESEATFIPKTNKIEPKDYSKDRILDLNSRV